VSGIGELFHQATKYPPPTEPDLPGLPAGPLRTVELPEPGDRIEGDLGKLLGTRRSRRKFSGEPISLEDLSGLLWAADGVTAAEPPGKYRTAPSAGARHPIDTYVVVNRVDGLEKGVYKYGVEEHSLALLREGDYERATAQAAAGQDWIIGSAVVLIWIGVFHRTTERYSERGYRYVFLDAGHICQNLYLACEAMGFGVTGIAALVDDAVNAIVGVDGAAESVVYMAALGRL
jgi:SagB-type dehydrogenase family enzyme